MAIRFKLDLKGINELMKSSEMQSVLDEHGQKVAAQAKGLASDQDAEYDVKTYPINWIAVANISAANGNAVGDNLRNNTVVKALK